MSNSPLTQFTLISPNRTSPRNHAIDTITIHCVVGQASVESLGSLFFQPSKKASSNYGIGSDGRIGLYVQEKDCSWCSSNQDNDNRAVTIEVASDSTAPYCVNTPAFAALIDLVTDICQRNGIKKLLWKNDKSLVGQVSKQNMTAHRWFAAKDCPGEYLYSRYGEIATQVNRKLQEEADTDQPAQSSKEFKVNDMVMFTGQQQYSSSLSTDLSGAFCSPGTARITRVNPGAPHPYHLMSGGGTAQVYGWVDAADITTMNTAPKTVTEIAKEVIAGKWGVGQDRQNRLKSAGYDSVAVQAKVNQLLAK